MALGQISICAANQHKCAYINTMWFAIPWTGYLQIDLDSIEQKGATDQMHTLLASAAMTQGHSFTALYISWYPLPDI